MERFIKIIFGVLTPFIKFLHNFINAPFSVKHITGDHYYAWRHKIKKGHVLLTNTNGAGTNLGNVSELNHGAIYFGAGLKTAIILLARNTNDIKLKDRLIKFLRNNNLKDEICYVIESVYEGVVATNLVKFMTTKDDFVCTTPCFPADNHTMELAANLSIRDLGLEYDYKFSENDNRRYCFEVVGKAYEDALIWKLNRKVYSLFGIRFYSTFMSSSFTDENWRFTIDSRFEKI